uniref:TPR_REGION domain-containing protein n=1 Tax=Steinernema glaseri TaxID=37863 RepID=A0A1I7YP75_9BILA
MSCNCFSVKQHAEPVNETDIPVLLYKVYGNYVRFPLTPDDGSRSRKFQSESAASPLRTADRIKSPVHAIALHPLSPSDDWGHQRNFQLSLSIAHSFGQISHFEMRRTPFVLLLLGCTLLPNVVYANSDEDSEEDSSEEQGRAVRTRGLHMLEDVGVTFLDALIKKGQMEMAKGAFKTQMQVLKKVQPDQYKKYKKIPIEQMAADAVFQQAEVAKLQPKTGNKLIDMLHENGIPIGSSLKGIEQAIKTQKEIEESDPSEQIAKAVFEKFQKQILPGLVANMIAGRNPFQMPQRKDMQQLTQEKNKERIFQLQHAEAMKALQAQQLANIQKVQGQQYDLNPMLLKRNENSLRRKPNVQKKTQWEDDEEEASSEEEETSSEEEETEDEDDETSSEEHKESNNVRRRHKRHAPHQEERNYNGRPLKELEQMAKETGEPQLDINIGSKAALVLGMTDFHGGGDDDDNSEDDDSEEEESGRRRAPIHLSQDLIDKLKSSARLRPLLSHEEIKYRASDPEELLAPLKPIDNPDPQPGYVVPRKIPARPRVMLPLTIGKPSEHNTLDSLFLPKPTLDSGDEDGAKPLEPFRRRPVQNVIGEGKSRVLENLRNNPSLTALFEDEELVQKLSKPGVLTSDQRGYDAMGGKGREIVTYPRLHGSKTFKGEKINPMDAKVKQLVEERPIPPLFYVPTGRHTRLRWTGATEQEIPGLGGRFILPSLDPTKPAFNSVVSTQGKQRDEYDSTFKVPNYWQGGDIFGIKTHTKSEKLIGGNGMVDFPAMGEDVTFGK